MKIRTWSLALFCALLLVACAQPTTTDTSTAPSRPPTRTQAAASVTATDIPTLTATLAITPSPSPKPASRIVFASNRGSSDPAKLDLFILDLTTMAVTPLHTGLDVLSPRWSPDGGKILFTAKGTSNLYTIKADGTQLTRITDFRSNDADWSPDGKQVVFESDFQKTSKDIPDIYSMEVGGGIPVDITNSPTILDINPRWAPGGRQILFISERMQSLDVFLMNTDGSNLVQVTHSYMPVISAAWSPDGKSIVYVTQFGKEATDLYVINKDGSPASVVPLTQDPAYDGGPGWSPDGKKIVFFSNRSGNYNLWTINPDGTGLAQLTNDAYYDAYPDWSP